MSASLNYKSNLCPTGISDPGYNADAKAVAPGSSELYASDMRCFFAICFSCVVLAGVLRAEPPAYVVLVSTERSGDVTVIAGDTNEVVANLMVANGRVGF